MLRVDRKKKRILRVNRKKRRLILKRTNLTLMIRHQDTDIVLNMGSTLNLINLIHQGTRKKGCMKSKDVVAVINTKAVIVVRDVELGKEGNRTLRKIIEHQGIDIR